MVLCSNDGGAHGGKEHWGTVLEKLTLSSMQLPEDNMYCLWAERRLLENQDGGVC